MATRWFLATGLMLAAVAAHAHRLRARQGHRRSPCPQPKPCVCHCFCPPVQYGTPAPWPQPNTGPAAELRPEPGASLLQWREQQAFGTGTLAPGRAILRPLPPTQPPSDRSFCPKAAACNCFCPCREDEKGG
mmetsp:Transcript_60550/g.188052  ORF Transcript_60550/g.188052 Transcript_60550/m.188052 type:complete len:132 (-) Transcript_60550:89-484(-)